MTTIDEFNKILETMYEKGYVLVKLTIWLTRLPTKTETPS